MAQGSFRKLGSYLKMVWSAFLSRPPFRAGRGSKDLKHLLSFRFTQKAGSCGFPKSRCMDDTSAPNDAIAASAAALIVIGHDQLTCAIFVAALHDRFNPEVVIQSPRILSETIWQTQGTSHPWAPI